MKFRTEIEPVKGSFEILPRHRIVLIGSCFADNIGERLAADGFNAVHNPLGPLFNPESIARVVSRGSKPYSTDDFYVHDGRWHCLDFANRYQADSPEALGEAVNADFLPFAKAIAEADVLIVTFGTNNVFRLNGSTVGNCHKLPGTLFEEHSLSVDEIAGFRDVLGRRPTILTLSPVRYPGKGLANGFLAKATLRVAIHRMCGEAECDYFPAFEMVNDDLRDYRFYAPDMRHPSEVAVDYIYDKFMDAYFSESTKQTALERRRQAIREAHRPIIKA